MPTNTNVWRARRPSGPRTPPRCSTPPASAQASGWPTSSLDAVHARFLAAPAGRLDRLVVEMMRIARPGGWVMLQEPDARTWQVPDAGAAWNRFVDLLRAGFAHRGGDFDAGRRIGSRLRAAGGRDVRLRHVLHQLPSAHPCARLPLSFCDSLRGLWVESRLACGDEVDALRAALARALDRGRGDVTTFTLVQAWGRA